MRPLEGVAIRDNILIEKWENMKVVMLLVPATVEHLVASANRRQLTTYGEIARSIGTHHRVVPKILWIIHDRCTKNEHPPLTAIVVRKDQSKPGPGFRDEVFPGVRDDHKDEEWKELLEQVDQFNWDSAKTNLV